MIHAAFAHGELSYAKVRALTRVATAENEEGLLEPARVFTAAQLERAVRAYRRVTTEDSRDLQEAAYLGVFWEPDGSLAIHGRLAPEDGALFLRALEALRDRQWGHTRGSAEPQPARQASRSEALVALCDAALAHPGEGRPAGERYQVVVHVDGNVLSEDGEGACELEDGSAVSPETARRLACDASLVRNGRKHGRCRRRCAGRCGRAIAAAASPVVRTVASSTPTTSTTGREADRRAWATCCSSAAAITASSTRAAIGSTGADASTTPPVSDYPPFRSCRASAHQTCSTATGRSGSTTTPATPAPATR
jgi:hypothetical protein